MTIRVTPSLSVTQLLARMTSQQHQIARLQQQATSGQRINRPSDDPARLRSLLRTEEEINRVQTRIDTAAAARFRLEQAHVAINQAQSLFRSAQTLAVRAVQAIEPAEREVLADEIDGLLRQLDALANAEVSGEYLFAGTATNRRPFADVSTSSVTTYAGSLVPRTLQLHSGPPTVLLASGADVFQPQSRTGTVFVGTTGAAAGTGTDSARGRGTLLVTHTATSYAAGSGVAAGSDSAAGDTIIGPAGAHRLTLIDESGTGAFGTVSLNGGPPVAFTSSDSNLKVTGPAGEIVYIDTTSISAGFSGDIDITASGSLSTDEGLTFIPVDFSSNQAVADSRTGGITHVNSTAIRATGREHLEYSGTADAFAVLRELRDDLRNTRGLSDGQQRDAITRKLADLERVHDHLLNILGEQSITLAQLDDVQTLAESARLEFQRLAADIGAADVAQVALELQQARNQLQYTLATAAGLFELSLLNFLR